MNRSPEPLSAEERALAERLARLDVRREPSPALDAAILAAARAAVTGADTPTTTAAAAIMTAVPPPIAASAQGDSNEGEDEGVENTPPKVVPLRPRKPLSRLPLGLSLAASLVLAAGIGWRLADGGGSESALESAPAQKAALEEQSAYSADTAATAAADATEAVILEPEMNRTPPPPPPLDSIESQRREIAMAPPAPEREAKRTNSISERDSEFVMDEGIAREATDADAAAGAFPAEPIAQSAPAFGNAAAAKSTAAGGAAEGLVGRARDRREAGKDDRAESVDKVHVTGARLARQAPVASPPPAAQAPAAPAASAASIADQPFDDQPPVSADSPEFRQAWLQRIRNLFAKGQADAGRTSLQEFRRRYPDSELPDDLKKIAATLPPPAP
jgi:resuscitation-promoting factor RpfA